MNLFLLLEIKFIWNLDFLIFDLITKISVLFSQYMLLKVLTVFMRAISIKLTHFLVLFYFTYFPDFILKVEEIIKS